MGRSSPRLLSAVVALGLLVLTGVLTAVAFGVNSHDQYQLLRLQVRQAAAALSSQLPVVQSQLVDAALVADSTGASPSVFSSFVGPKLSATGPFASISLWRVTGAGASEITQVGSVPELAREHRISAFLSRVHPSASLFVTPVLHGQVKALGYAEMPPGERSRLVVYAERVLPTSQVSLPASSPFSELNFALYLGRHETPADLIEASAPVPIQGQKAVVTLPFGDATVTVVGTAAVPLESGPSNALPWIVLAFGLVVALGGAATVGYVAKRRRLAEGLATENRRLYLEQRDLAGTLQRALLPPVPVAEELEVTARYHPGVAGVDVGGDWYDVVWIEPDRCAFVVGDVSGRGIEAATTMAALRHSIRAYLADSNGVDEVLAKLGALLDVDADRKFATVLAGEIDLATRTLTVASSGHLPPVVVSAGKASFVELAVSAPIGVRPPGHPKLASVILPPGATVVAYTDGLVERRGEDLDEGLERLRSVVATMGSPLEAELDRVVSVLGGDAAGDDVVVLVLRCRD